MDYQGFDVFENSINRKGPSTVFMARDGDGTFIIVQGKNPGFTGK